MLIIAAIVVSWAAVVVVALTLCRAGAHVDNAMDRALMNQVRRESLRPVPPAADHDGHKLAA